MDTADLVVTRGGSNTIFELLAMKKLHLIIPLGKEASRGDQLENAAYFERKGYARQLQETELSWETLNHELEQLVEHAETYKEAMAKSEEITSPDDFYNLLVTSISKKIKGISWQKRIKNHKKNKFSQSGRRETSNF